MRSFAFSIALGVIGGDMQFTAASGLVNSIMILLFASVVGGWVDKTSRLKGEPFGDIVCCLARSVDVGCDRYCSNRSILIKLIKLIDTAFQPQGSL